MDFYRRMTDETANTEVMHITSSCEAYPFVDEQCLVSVQFNFERNYFTCGMMIYDKSERNYWHGQECSKHFYDKEVWREIRSTPAFKHDGTWHEVKRYFDWYHGFDSDYCPW